MKVCCYCGRENEEAAHLCCGCGTREFASAPSALAVPKAPAKPGWLSPDTAMTILQVLGTLAALNCLRLFALAYGNAVSGDWLRVVVQAGFGSYFVYVGYLTRGKFSPLAIQHICGATSYLVFCACLRIIKHTSDDKAVQGFCTLLLVALIVWIYRKAWRYFSGLICYETGNIPPSQ